ncbi:hypothetical protein ACFVU3_11000 [Streptomyces sp. NPDC058052]|uniref:hypothetical protein n=1 Tax=Streptomyces sp. NPDC058052 TaxID=3346316 RepID=UPI0036E0709A
MVLIGEFFLADDDESARRVRPRVRHGFAAVECDGTYPDDAVPRWERSLTGAESPHRAVVPMANDGFTVFAVPRPLAEALAGAATETSAEAGRERLRTAAGEWARVATEQGDDVSPERAADLLERLSALAADGKERGLALYCWYFAP